MPRVPLKTPQDSKTAEYGRERKPASLESIKMPKPVSIPRPPSAKSER
jgi:hypothetical protein